MRKYTKRWSLPRLCKENRYAPGVWLALIYMAQQSQSRVIFPTRKGLAELISINRHRDISEALTALVKAGWIKRFVSVKSEDNGIGGKSFARAIRVEIIKARSALAYAPGFDFTSEVPKVAHGATIASARQALPDSPSERKGDKPPPFSLPREGDPPYSVPKRTNKPIEPPKPIGKPPKAIQALPTRPPWLPDKIPTAEWNSANAEQRELWTDLYGPIPEDAAS